MWSMLLVLAASAAHAIASSAPPIPLWPNAFSVVFNETTSDIISNNSFTGTYYYDFTNSRSRMDRSTGKYDRYCGSVNSADSPCTHLVVGGIRYLWWPALQPEVCCQCCTAANGCGVTRPDWMEQSNATYQGTQAVTTPNWNGTADVWEASGLQPNYWYQTVDTGLPVELAQIPDDYQYFNPASFVAAPQPDSLFSIPPSCGGACPLLSICSFANDS